MKSLTTETALDILIAWLQDNIDCESGGEGGYPYPAPTAASATEPVSLTHQTSFH